MKSAFVTALLVTMGYRAIITNRTKYDLSPFREPPVAKETHGRLFSHAGAEHCTAAT
jgi:hypothetical protein